MSTRQFTVGAICLGLVAILHAAWTWPLRAVIVLFLGGALIAFVGEVIVIYDGWLRHHIGPKIAQVPVYALFGWTGVIYVSFRIALFLGEGWIAITLAAMIATAYDLLTDHIGVESGYWTYTYGGPGPRVRDVPWWNFAGWFLITVFITGITYPFT